jgi:hypothetical protein
LKKLIGLFLVFILVLGLAGCGKSDEVKNVERQIEGLGTITIDSESVIIEAEQAYNALSEDEKERVENYDKLVTAREEFTDAKFVDEWLDINNGDVYIFEGGGIGSHNDMAIKYSFGEDNTVVINEGTGTVKPRILTLDSSDEIDKLIPEGENTYYVRSKDYDLLSSQLKDESIKILKSVEFWKSTKAVNYISFYIDGVSEDGNGWFIVKGTTLPLEWEMIDNDTVKVFVDYNGGYSINLDIVNNNGSYQLQDSKGEVAYVPKQ